MLIFLKNAAFCGVAMTRQIRELSNDEPLISRPGVTNQLDENFIITRCAFCHFSSKRKIVNITAPFILAVHIKGHSQNMQ